MVHICIILFAENESSSVYKCHVCVTEECVCILTRFLAAGAVLGVAVLCPFRNSLGGVFASPCCLAGPGRPSRIQQTSVQQTLFSWQAPGAFSCVVQVTS